VQRLLAIWCPGLLEEQEHGREARVFGAVVAALGAWATRVDPVRPGVCAVPTRGPSRYFGGDEVLAGMAAEAVAGAMAPEAVAGAMAAEAVAGATDGAGRSVGVGVADGLFAAVVAARAATRNDGPVIVPPGGTPSFLGPWPVAVLDRPELADLLVRLGVRTLGGFAALPGPQVLARFGAEGALCQRVARGVEGELPGFRLFFPPVGPGRADGAAVMRTTTRQVSFWGDSADADARAGRAATGVQELLGPEAVVRGRLQGGRGPAQRARFVPWTGPDRDGGDLGAAHDTGGRGSRDQDGPWPGQVPPPAPAVVLSRPLPTLLTDAGGRAVGVTGAGMATTTPGRLSVAGGPWVEVTAWAGPWPSDERWWSVRGRRRQARMQVVTAHTAHLLTRERGGWWLEATYD
jgi:protein ImuB